MHFSQILFRAALIVSSATANWCATEHPSEEVLSSMHAMRLAERSDSFGIARRGEQLINIPVYFHAVVNTTDSDETLSDAVLQKQLEVLVHRFAPHNITFTLQATDRLVDDDLARGYTSPNWNGHLFSTRKGSYATLNMWYVTNMDPATGGACSLPSASHGPGTVTGMLDGCTMQSYSVPGGQYNGTTYLGEISVHEVGHWLGLLHTFQGNNCTGEGDYVDDTPAEASYEFMACPIGKDTCPDQPGLDPIENFMDYSGDGCWKRFTPGQKARMRNSWYTMRLEPPASNSTTA
ncbi:Fc.00g046110.m01.CDS01 [Cosmosporella sp. VM-42]